MTPTLDPEFDYPTGSAALFHNHAASRSARVCIRCGKPNDCILYLLCLECHDADLAMSTALSIVVYECENPLNLFPAGTDLAAGTSPRCACFEKVGVEVKDIKEVPGISATEIRRRMREGGDWRALVPSEVASYLGELNATERLRQM